jgi:outer membrane protein assembly factor BamD
MKNKLFVPTLLILVLAVALSSCRSEFEQIRTSGDSKRIYDSAMALYDAGEYSKAQSLLELCISNFRGMREAEDIYFKYAYTYYFLENYLMSSYYFTNFSQTYATSTLREEADFMSAYSNYLLSPTFRLDQTYSQKAIDEFQLFVNTYPFSERVTECNRLMDELRQKQEIKVFEAGKLYYDLRQYQAAIQTFDNLLKDYPDTANPDEVRYFIVKSAYQLAVNSIVQRKEERFRETITKADLFLKKYPESTYVSEVNAIVADTNQQLKLLQDVRYQN